MVEATPGRDLRITRVTDPRLVVYEANPARNKGAAVIVCPGGGYRGLAFEKEGGEVAAWLSRLGYTAFVLQYRVPDNPDAALLDGVRAVRCVRGMASRWGVDPNRIGVLGFSAGGSLTARIWSLHATVRYPRVDAYDALSGRPDFAALIYPAYLDRGPGGSLTPELSVGADTPPVFIFVAADDGFANSSLVLGAALQRANQPYELHVLPSGGHGFGMRTGNPAGKRWPEWCARWMETTLGLPSDRSQD